MSTSFPFSWQEETALQMEADSLVCYSSRSRSNETSSQTSVQTGLLSINRVLIAPQCHASDYSITTLYKYSGTSLTYEIRDSIDNWIYIWHIISHMVSTIPHSQLWEYKETYVDMDWNVGGTQNKESSRSSKTDSEKVFSNARESSAQTMRKVPQGSAQD